MDAAAVVSAQLNKRVPGFDGLVESDITLAAVGLPFAAANSARAARFTSETADRRIDEVIAWFDARRVPFVWRLGPVDQPSDLYDRLIARGFEADPGEGPGMAARLTDLPPIELPESASLELVRDSGTFRTWLDVVVAGFGMPAEIGDAYLKYAVLGFGDELPIRSFLARLDGRPVATAVGFLAAGGVLIASVTTVPDARARGLGRAMTLGAMHDAASAGARIAVLESSEMGYGVYRRLGFEEFGRYRSVVWARR